MHIPTHTYNWQIAEFNKSRDSCPVSSEAIWWKEYYSRENGIAVYACVCVCACECVCVIERTPENVHSQAMKRCRNADYCGSFRADPWFGVGAVSAQPF